MNNTSITIDIKDTPDPSILIDGCNELGISLTEEQTAQFVRYYELLHEKNKVMNLTAVTQWEEVQTRHFLDSLLICGAADIAEPGKKILDLGTGAGFPGIPLKIVYPELDIVLADSLNKRILFLNEVIEELRLNRISTVHGRAEDLGRNEEYREAFDLVVSRAVAGLSTLCEYCLPFVKKDGQFISYKATGIVEELSHAQKAVRILGGAKPEVVTLPLPCAQMDRAFVIIRKENHTPAKYPRKAGTPSRDPL